MSSNLRHKLSRIFQPITVIPKGAQLIKKQEISSKSQKLLLEMGIIKQANPGSYHFLPLGVKALEKLTKLVDDEMRKIGAQKVILPALISSKLWEITGRINENGAELFQVKDRHNHNYILSPTHEEAASEIFTSNVPLSYKNFPLLLYQITQKYRDEMKPRFGLMRSRQFLMKDLYSFDINIENARETYWKLCESYQRIFTKIGVDYVQVEGSVGNMGGSLSHEFHYRADIGEDKIVTCKSCGYAANLELLQDAQKCSKCSQPTDISHGIEVGHTFFLGDKYSEPLKAMYLSKTGKPVTLQMGSYGLGLSRIIGASLEVLSSETEIRWPDCIVPYNVIVIPPKHGSKEQEITKNFDELLFKKLEEIPHLVDNVLLDDRTHLTIGKRFIEAKRMGYPFIVVIGQKAVENIPLYEINDLTTNTQTYLPFSELINYLSEKFSAFNSTTVNKQAIAV